MASCRPWLCRIPPLKRYSSFSSSSSPFLSSPLVLSPLSPSPPCIFTLSASLTQRPNLPADVNTTTNFYHHSALKRTWKPLCLYYTQGKCIMMNDPLHMDKFNHSCSEPLEANIAESKKLHPQHIDFFLVLDLEGKVEILEFPVMMIDAKTMEVIDFFHRFVRPSRMSEQRISEYIEGKYGKLGVDRVWHDTAMPFGDVIQEFEVWMTHHSLWTKELRGPLQKAAFVTCGNWDVKTKIPQQCQVCDMKVPPYFMEWINLKDIYLNFYSRRASGMRTMLNELEIPLLGSHHLGIDDTKNIARVLQRMLADGALMQITARRNPAKFETVEFLFKNRIR